MIKHAVSLIVNIILNMFSCFTVLFFLVSKSVLVSVVVFVCADLVDFKPSETKLFRYV
jgi:hypothetical protein